MDRYEIEEQRRQEAARLLQQGGVPQALDGVRMQPRAPSDEAARILQQAGVGSALGQVRMPPPPPQSSPPGTPLVLPETRFPPQPRRMPGQGMAAGLSDPRGPERGSYTFGTASDADPTYPGAVRAPTGMAAGLGDPRGGEDERAKQLAALRALYAAKVQR